MTSQNFHSTNNTGTRGYYNLQQCLSTEWIGQLEETGFDTGQDGNEEHFLPFLFDSNTGFP